MPYSTNRIRQERRSHVLASATLACLSVVIAGAVNAQPARSPAFSSASLTNMPTDGWVTNGGSIYNQRYSPLTQINQDNVVELGLAWSREIGGYNMRMQGTPLVVDGVMYVSNGWSVVHALDATTGELIWRHDPQVAARRSAALPAAGSQLRGPRRRLRCQ